MGYAVFLGDVARDEYYKVDKFPALGEKVAVNALPVQLGGMIANAACVYAKYGGETKFLSALNPRDSDLCEELKAYGVDAGLVLYDDALPDSKCMIFLSEEEHTVFIISMGDFCVTLTPEAQKALCGADIIYSNFFELSRLRYGNMGCVEIVRQWSECGVKIICDIDVDSINDTTAGFLPYTEVLFMNRVGFQNQCGGRSEKETVDEILRSGVKILVVTLADEGCVIYEHGSATKLDGVKADVVDVTGAGDTFCSTFAWLYLRINDPTAASVFATYAASRSVSQMGARSGAVGAEPVLEYMKAHGTDITNYKKFFRPQGKEELL